LNKCFKAISDNQKADLLTFTRGNLATEMELSRKRMSAGGMSYFSSGAGTLAYEVIGLTDDDQPAKRRRMPQGELVDLTIEEEDLIDLPGQEH
jgi:hypothetical protein